MCSWCKTVIRDGDPIAIDGEGDTYHPECRISAVEWASHKGGFDLLVESVIRGPWVGVRGEARILRTSTPVERARRVE